MWKMILDSLDTLDPLDPLGYNFDRFWTLHGTMFALCWFNFVALAARQMSKDTATNNSSSNSTTTSNSDGNRINSNNTT